MYSKYYVVVGAIRVDLEHISDFKAVGSFDVDESYDFLQESFDTDSEALLALRSFKSLCLDFLDKGYTVVVEYAVQERQFFDDGKEFKRRNVYFSPSPFASI